jgi:hypothetical protein
MTYVSVIASEQRNLFQSAMNIRLLRPTVCLQVHEDGLSARLVTGLATIPTDDFLRLLEIPRQHAKCVEVCFSTSNLAFYRKGGKMVLGLEAASQCHYHRNRSS